MLALYLLVVAAIVGFVASRGQPGSLLLYVAAAMFGGFLGAFAAFGDAPFPPRCPLVNPFTLALGGSASLVAAVRVWKGRGTPRR